MDVKTEEKLYNEIERVIERVRNQSVVRGGQLVALNVIDVIDNNNYSNTEKLDRLKEMCSVILNKAKEV